MRQVVTTGYYAVTAGTKAVQVYPVLAWVPDGTGGVAALIAMGEGWVGTNLLRLVADEMGHLSIVDDDLYGWWVGFRDDPFISNPERERLIRAAKAHFKQKDRQAS